LCLKANGEILDDEEEQDAKTFDFSWDWGERARAVCKAMEDKTFPKYFATFIESDKILIYISGDYAKHFKRQ
jgi:hypothetical protein